MVASVAVMKTQLNACIMFLLRVVLFGRDFLVQKGIVTASTMGIPESGSFSCVLSTESREHQHLRTTGSFLSAPSLSRLLSPTSSPVLNCTRHSKKLAHQRHCHCRMEAGNNTVLGLFLILVWRAVPTLRPLATHESMLSSCPFFLLYIKIVFVPPFYSGNHDFLGVCVPEEEARECK